MEIEKRSTGSLEAETLRQKIGNKALRRAFFTLIENNGARTEFINDLAARAARRARNPVIIGDGDGPDFKFWTIFRNRRKDSSALGAIGHSVRRVLNIAPNKDAAFRCENGRAHSELGKGRVSILHHFARRTEQALPNGR